MFIIQFHGVCLHLKIIFDLNLILNIINKVVISYCNFDFDPRKFSIASVEIKTIYNCEIIFRNSSLNIRCENVCKSIFLCLGFVQTDKFKIENRSKIQK